MKILVVEDDRTVGQYVKRGLEEQRYHADLVDDGMEGLRLASGGRYEIIVSAKNCARGAGSGTA